MPDDGSRPTHPLLRALADIAASLAVSRPGTLPGANAGLAAAPAAGRPTNSPSERLRRSLRMSLADGMLAEIVNACSGGAVLTGWALHLGCSPLVIGLLASLPFFAQFAQLPSAFLAARFGPRRVAVFSVAVSRQAVLPLALMPWLPLSPASKQLVLLGCASAAALFAVLANNAWVSWMGDLVPERLRGRYFGRRTAVCTLTGTVASLIAGWLLDGGHAASAVGYVLAGLTVVSLIAGAVSAWAMAHIHEPESFASPKFDRSALVAPLRDPSGRRLLAYQLVWNAAIGFSGGYLTLHLLENLKMGFFLVALHGVAVAFTRIVVGPLWGRAIDRVGSRPVLVACSFGIALIPLNWMLADENFLWPVLIDAVYAGALWSGHALASFNLPLAIAPRASRGFFVASFAIGGGLAYSGATLLGGAALESLPQRAELFGHPVFGFHLLLLLSFVTRFTAAVLSTRIVERGSRPVDELARLVRGRLALPLVRR